MFTVEIGHDRTKEYSNDKGNFHREDGPALIEYNGTTTWYCNGVRFNLNGPCTRIYGLGTALWRTSIHKNYPYREDGPAWDTPSGHKKWFDGKAIWPVLK